MPSESETRYAWIGGYPTLQRLRLQLLQEPLAMGVMLRLAKAPHRARGCTVGDCHAFSRRLINSACTFGGRCRRFSRYCGFGRIEKVRNDISIVLLVLANKIYQHS